MNVLVFISELCQRFMLSWWESSVSAYCCLTMPSTKTQSGENLAVHHVLNLYVNVARFGAWYAECLAFVFSVGLRLFD